MTGRHLCRALRVRRAGLDGPAHVDRGMRSLVRSVWLVRGRILFWLEFHVLVLLLVEARQFSFLLLLSGPVS